MIESKLSITCRATLTNSAPRTWGAEFELYPEVENRLPDSGLWSRVAGSGLGFRFRVSGLWSRVAGSGSGAGAFLNYNNFVFWGALSNVVDFIFNLSTRRTRKNENVITLRGTNLSRRPPGEPRAGAHSSRPRDLRPALRGGHG